MRSLRVLTSLSCLSLLSFFARDPVAAQAPQADSPSYEAGGAEIAIPVPWSGAVEMGPDRRHFMDQFVPPSNRLIAGFVDAGDLPKVHTEDVKAPPRIAMVAVSRQFESRNITESDFKSIIDNVSKSFNATVSAYATDNEEEFNRRLHALNLDDAKISFAEPVSLGCLFSTPDSAGFGTIMQVSASGGSPAPGAQNTLTRALSVLYIRARNRVLFAYVYADYKDKSTILWLRKASEDWTNEIVQSNK